MKYKIILDIEADQRKELFEAYIRYSLKMIKINKVKIEEVKK